MSHFCKIQNQALLYAIRSQDSSTLGIVVTGNSDYKGALLDSLIWVTAVSEVCLVVTIQVDAYVIFHYVYHILMLKTMIVTTSCFCYYEQVFNLFSCSLEMLLGEHHDYDSEVSQTLHWERKSLVLSKRKLTK